MKSPRLQKISGCSRVDMNIGDFKHIDVDEDIRGGRPCIAGHRITVAQIVQEINEGNTPGEIEEQFDLDEGVINDVLAELSMYLNQRGFDV